MTNYPPIDITCFKAYDIRGKLGTQLNVEVAYRIGRTFGQHLKPKQVVVGGDVRLTSAELKDALADGLLDTRGDVVDLGQTGTEEIYFATSYLGIDGGVEVTASHNPMDYNDMKMVAKDSKPISNDTGLLEIRALAESGKSNTEPLIRLNLETRSDVELMDKKTAELLQLIESN